MGRLSAGVGGDYSGERPGGPFWRPHDLAWLARDALADDAPEWARASVALGLPVVVRRAPRDAWSLPVGVRGTTRSQRFAARVSLAVLDQRVSPESLARQRTRHDAGRTLLIPALSALDEVAAVLDATSYIWGIGGAIGYELATETPAAHVDSDIDILIRTPRQPDQAELAALTAALNLLSVRCDVQMETPIGGVALKDWQAGNRRVLVKSDQGPFLSDNPWLSTTHGLDPDQVASCR
ncbi:MAG: malonate decarboxylase holo-ACP synthase [Salinisphaera sp.]|nr:malonate decarboxylase holo-ACP synthase [Salinisphaera sp.]